MSKSIPKGFRGSIVDNNGYWCYIVRLPGETKRRKHPLRAPGATVAMRSDRPRELAVSAAHRVWEAAMRIERHAPAGPTVADVADAWAIHVPRYYRGDGSKYMIPIRDLRDMFGDCAASELTHRDMLAVRDAFIRRGWSRPVVNSAIWTVKAMWSWALDEGLISAAVKGELTQVKGLKRGRSDAPEPPPVRPVDDATLEATIAELTPATADMVRVHRFTGMRPGEICAMRWEDIDTARTPWVYRPPTHKNEWRNQPRVVCIGPKARNILLGRRKPQGSCFSPMEAVREMLAAKSAAAHCHRARPPKGYADATRRPGESWTTGSYTGAIEKAAVRAGLKPWGANRLRHAFATEVRRKFGLEACRAVLGHSMGARITDRYSFDAIEDEIVEKAAPAVEALG